MARRRSILAFMRSTRKWLLRAVAVGVVLGAWIGAWVAGGTDGARGAVIGAVVLSIALMLLVAWVIVVSRLRRPAWVRVLLGVGVPVLVVAALVLARLRLPPKETSRPVPAQSVPAANTWNALAREYAPTLVFNRGELFVPIDRASYVDDTQLKESAPDGTETMLDRHPTPQSLPTQSCQDVPGCYFLLDVTGAEPSPANRASAHAYDSLEERRLDRGGSRTVYARVTRYTDSGEYAIQYWFLYYFNYRLNEHESDWEHIIIQLGPDKRPINALYSAHLSGHVRPWGSVEHLGQTESPLVYVALGSHANYFRSGSYSVPTFCGHLKGRKICYYENGVCDVAHGNARKIRRLTVGEGYQIRRLSGPVFSGNYGSGNYVLGKRHADKLTDPRTRTQWRDPLRPLQTGSGEKARPC